MSEEYGARFWQRLEDGRMRCDLCPRHCQLRPRQRGVCFVRAAREDRMVLTTYGRSSGFCVDPIEKKPLNHFYPGTPVLSFGTAGCNLTCRFCQNWDISRARETDILAAVASPQAIARAARDLGCRSVAFTYNDPVVFHEYAVDTARACHAAGVATVAVTAAAICAEPRAEFFAHMDAANVDLKAFSNRFYQELCGMELRPVLDSLEYVAQETDVWLELTTLLIPGENDTDEELHGMCEWVVRHLGPDVPMHFTAFHPAWRMQDHAPTAAGTLRRARRIARECGVHHAYTGNVHDAEGGSTYCSSCGHRLVRRDWYELSEWQLTDTGCCPRCGRPCPGRFAPVPGDWGARRLPVDMTAYA